MKMTTVLFDLDGTLLPMDQDRFMKAYFGGLAKKMAPHGYDPDALIKAIWAGTASMVKNDGTRTNEDAFWAVFASMLGEKVRADAHLLEEFYQTDFPHAVAEGCWCDARAGAIVNDLRARGFCVLLATNPLFPRIATEARIRHAGLSPNDFALVTTYENASHCKPNLDYYRDILQTIGKSPKECLMVGNDVDEDMIARELGMQVFLLTDCLLNKQGRDISEYPNGDFDDLSRFLQNL